jgi:hypothetical protein
MLFHAGSGKFTVHYPAASGRQDGKIYTAVGFNKHLFAHCEEFFCKQRSIFLKQRFAAGDFDGIAVGSGSFIKQTLNRTLFSSLPGIGGITVTAS